MVNWLMNAKALLRFHRFLARRLKKLISYYYNEYNAGRRWTVDGGHSLRKVLPRSGLGHRASDKGENPCRDAETTQLVDYAMIHLVMRSS